MPRRSLGPWYRTSRDQWYVCIGEKMVSLGVRGRENRDEAIVAWHRVLGNRPVPSPAPESDSSPGSATGARTVRQLVDVFLADAKSRLKPYTVATYAHDLNLFCQTFGPRVVTSLVPAELRTWLWGLPVGSTTKSIRGRSVSAFLGWAVRAEFLDANPMKKVQRPRGHARSESALISKEDHQKLLAAASPEFAIVLRVLHATGCRPGELRGITAEGFHPDENLVVLRVHKADRTGKPRIIFLPADVTAALRVQLGRWLSGPLLRSMGGTPWSSRGVLQAMSRLREKTGVTATAYGYRHTYATDALAAGVPDAQVAALLGHASTEMIHKHYSHLTSRTAALHHAVSQVRPNTNAG